MSGPPDPKTAPSTAIANAPPANLALSPEEQRQREQRSQLKAALRRVAPALAVVLPKTMDPARFVKTVLIATEESPGLLECAPDTIVLAVMRSADLGLEIGGPLGEAYPVPFRDKHRTDNRKGCKLIIGYRGWLKLVRQSSEVSTVQSQVVYEGDLFEMNLAENAILHTPSWSPTRPRTNKQILGAYVVFKFKNGDKQIDWMRLDEIEAIRQQSQARDDSAWTDHFPRMCCKTVIRRAVHNMPTSAIPPELRSIAAGADDELGPVRRDYVSAVAPLAAKQLPSGEDDDT